MTKNKILRDLKMNRVKEIAQTYRFSERTIYRDLKKGVFPYTKNERDEYVISDKNIEDWIKNRQGVNFKDSSLKSLQSSISVLNQNLTEHVPKHYNQCGGVSSRKNYKGVKRSND